MYVCVCVCVYVCMYVCMYMCMYVCVCVCVCVCNEKTIVCDNAPSFLIVLTPLKMYKIGIFMGLAWKSNLNFYALNNKK
jgi:hypothetical protein